MYFMMKLDELLKRVGPLDLNHLTLLVPFLVIYTITTLIPYDHVVHDHTSSYHLPHWLNAHVLKECQTIAQQDWTTPKSRSTSFLAPYFPSVNLSVTIMFLFRLYNSYFLCRPKIMHKNVLNSFLAVCDFYCCCDWAHLGRRVESGWLFSLNLCNVYSGLSL